MIKKKLNISIIIIGYNSKKNLSFLLQSLSRIKNQNDVLEIIYVDDGSKDGSLDLFQKMKLNFHKKCFGFKDNRGRVFARQKGVDLASGNWFLFLNSTVVVDAHIISHYKRVVQRNQAKAYMGSIIYHSKDLEFEKYLNHKKRGINRCKDGESVHYKYLLFSNCFLSKDLFKNIKFNFKLNYYGGEEIDFSYQLSYKYSNQIVAVKKALVNRVNVPSLEDYLHKLFEFGNKNLKSLSPVLQKDILGSVFLVKQKKTLFPLISFLNFCCLKLVKLSFFRRNYFVVRCLFLLNILRGFYIIK